jgi:hypothetical protein
MIWNTKTPYRSKDIPRSRARKLVEQLGDEEVRITTIEVRGMIYHHWVTTVMSNGAAFLCLASVSGPQKM